MKYLSHLFLSFCLFIPLAYADSGKDCDRSEKVLDKLGLSEEQREPVKEILQQQKEKRHAVMEKQRQQMKQEMESLHNDTVQSLTGVLSEEQLEEYQAMHHAFVEKMQERRNKWKERRQQFKNVDSENTSVENSDTAI